MAHHTIALGPRYRQLLGDIFDRKVLADDFSLYLHRPTATDPPLAPPGCDAFYVLSPVPHLEAGVDWAERAEPYRQAIEDRLAATLLPGLGAEIASSRLLTPQHFQDELSSLRGAAFSLEPVLTQSAWFRPSQPERGSRPVVPRRCRDPPGCRIAGGVVLGACAGFGGAPW